MKDVVGWHVDSCIFVNFSSFFYYIVIYFITCLVHSFYGAFATWNNHVYELPSDSDDHSLFDRRLNVNII
jgi:hypothetical protein